MSPYDTASPQASAPPRSMKIQSPRPDGVADRLVTFSMAARAPSLTLPRRAASPKAVTVPRPSTTQSPASDGVGSRSTASAPDGTAALPSQRASPKAYTVPPAPTIQ